MGSPVETLEYLGQCVGCASLTETVWPRELKSLLTTLDILRVNKRTSPHMRELGLVLFGIEYPDSILRVFDYRDVFSARSCQANRFIIQPALNQKHRKHKKRERIVY